MEFILRDYSCFSFKQKFSEFVIALRRGVHKKCHSVVSVAGVHLDFAGTEVEKSFNWLDLAEFACVDHRCFVRCVAAFENVDVRFQN